MEDKRKKQNGQAGPYIPDVEVPDPPVPNRAHTEMSLGDFAPDKKGAQGKASLGNFDPKTAKHK